MKDTGKTIRWHLDLASNTATPEKPGAHLASFKVPLRPMLGCVAVAVNPSNAPPGTGDSGNWGGNMDFNEIGDGATLYLPVMNPGRCCTLAMPTLRRETANSMATRSKRPWTSTSLWT